MGGGQFSIRLQEHVGGSDEGKASVFERIMEMLIKHEFVDCAKLNGVCFGKRGEKQHIKMWTSTTDLGLQAITDQLHDVCEALCSRHMKITFISFKDLHNEKLCQMDAESIETSEALQQTPAVSESPSPRPLAAKKPDEKPKTEGSSTATPATPAAAVAPQPAGGIPKQYLVAMMLAYMLGLLANDSVFDVAPLSISRAYYCTLLDSITRFPHFIRLMIPVAIIGACLVHRLVFSEMRPFSLHVDAATAILLGVGGSVSFFHTIQLSRGMCAAHLTPENKDAVQDMRSQMVPWHLFMGCALLTALVLQCMGAQYERGSPATKMD